MNNINKKRWIILYYSIYIYVGMSGAIFGPSLLKLIDQTDSSLGLISLIFPARAFSYLAGSWIAGYLFDKYQGHRLLTRILPFIGITLVLVPLIKTPWSLIFISMIMAVATSLVDVGCNSLLYRVPDIDTAPAVNGLHFFFGLGSFLSPLILAGSLKISGGIRFGFWGLALFSLIILLQFIKLPEALTNIPDKSDDLTSEGSLQVNQKTLAWVIALFFFAFVGVEIGYGDWLSTYSIKSGLANEQIAILLTSTYWGVFTLSRLIGIPLAAKFKPGMILLADLIGAVVGLGLVFLFPELPAILWIGTIILGISVASLFPTMLNFAERFLPMTGRVTSIFFSSGSVGSILLPWIIGRSVEELGPRFIIQVLFYTLILAGLVFLWLIGLTRKPAVTTAGLNE